MEREFKLSIWIVASAATESLVNLPPVFCGDEDRPERVAIMMAPTTMDPGIMMMIKDDRSYPGSSSHHRLSTLDIVL
jgi:hypothetical protein